MTFPCNIFGTDYVDEMRGHRNRLLAESDWTVLADSPLDAETLEAWKQWRQELRDFPSTWVPAPSVTFPDPPS